MLLVLRVLLLVVMVVQINHVVPKVVEMVVDWDQTDNLKVRQLVRQVVLVLP